ncbi:uncharacterized protein MELLADRAFT_88993 [Melampsora larici-populina 98AG31]|uniref:Uncharacterized protein n=1 Tax=Melampsora larici-populina (strain 98AG31 / pathotype 3-4-7) TaxID=747676 RepID=F4R6J8_MELLP|nr:uncharacterized protein MELLADRAFT_88993 [Melampsora larici-populina 98AG31]EGG12452.1 hypothetical protein MELLADRAFT_88993 [Melampsora larici-populina 98AG31]
MTSYPLEAAVIARTNSDRHPMNYITTIFTSWNPLSVPKLVVGCLLEFISTFFYVWISKAMVKDSFIASLEQVHPVANGHLNLAILSGCSHWHYRLRVLLLGQIAKLVGHDLHMDAGVSLSLLVLDRSPAGHVLPYLGSQILGAIAAISKTAAKMPTQCSCKAQQELE